MEERGKHDGDRRMGLHFTEDGDSGSPQQPTIFSSSALSRLIRPADLTHILPTKSDLGAFVELFGGFQTPES